MHANPSPWRMWMHRVALCLESAKPASVEVADVLRSLGTAGALNGISRQEAEAALQGLEIRCGLLKPENATEHLAWNNISR